MATAWTVPKLVTWRVRDWASCFLACRFPLDDGEDQGNVKYCSASTQLQFRNMFLDKKEEKRTAKKKKKKKKLTRPNQFEKQRRLSLSPPSHSRTKSVSSENRRLSWPHFSDEDYIVFCFNDDGAFDVVKEVDKDTDVKDTAFMLETSSRSVNRKLCYGDKHDDEHNRINNKIEGETIPDVQKDAEVKEKEEEEEAEEEQEQESSCACGESYSGCSRRLSCKGDEEENVGESGKAESSESDNSDGSTGSFAFPVLGWEWMGSPVQMPKSDDSNSRRQKMKSLGLQCCRF